MIKTQQVVAPESPTLQLSSKARPLIAVLVFGAILLLVVVSAAEAVDTLRAERREGGLPERDMEDSIEGTPARQRLGGARGGRGAREK